MEIKNLPSIGVKPILSLIRHYRMALAVWLVVMIIGTPVAWIKGEPHYEAESIFQVSPTYMKNVEADSEIQIGSNSQYREYVSHLAKTVVRYDVIERALDNLAKTGIDLKPAALTQRKFIEKLQQRVFVSTIPDTYMVRIGIESNEKNDLDTLINAITGSFLDTTKNEQIYGSAERLQFIHEAETKIRAEISALEASRVVLAEKLGVTTFTENTLNPFDAVLTQARDRLTRAAIERTEADASYQIFIKQKELPFDFRFSLRDLRQQDLGMQTMRNEVFKRIEEITQALTGLTSSHPLYQGLVDEMEKITADLNAREEAYDLKSIENYKVRLAATLDQKKRIEQEVQKTVISLEGQAADYARTFQQAMRLTSEIKKRDAELETVRNRENFLDTERNALGFVRLVTPALPAETPSGTGKTRSFTILLILALGCALGSAIMMDMSDRRIRSVNEAESLMGIPAAGWQILVNNLPTRLFGMEQTQRFAATLIRNRDTEAGNLFAFSSVKGSPGLTNIILETAATLRQLGHTVLVVQANTYSPIAGLAEHARGLTEYLNGSANATEIIHPYVNNGITLDLIEFGKQIDLGVKNLDVLSAGVKQWEQSYDFVLIDLPPLLLSADAELLVESLGQVFLVVEAESVLRGEVSRAKRLLQKIDPKAVGLFVNSVPMFFGGGYMEALVVETIIRKNYNVFMNKPSWLLQLQIFWTRWYVQYKLGRQKLRPALVAQNSDK
jgi:Mrp family chromosome partitioning ATPase/uncharacterized protein involved in exopolysaccharide biosynthesis